METDLNLSLLQLGLHRTRPGFTKPTSHNLRIFKRIFVFFFLILQTWNNFVLLKSSNLSRRGNFFATNFRFLKREKRKLEMEKEGGGGDGEGMTEIPSVQRATFLEGEGWVCQNLWFIFCIFKFKNFYWVLLQRRAWSWGSKPAPLRPKLELWWEGIEKVRVQ